MTEPVARTENSGRTIGAPLRNRRRRWRPLPWVGALLVAGLIVAGLWPRALPVEIGTVSVGTLRATVNEEGKTRIKQRYVLSAPVSGQLRRIPFKAGAEVKAGETVLAVIDPPVPSVLDPRARATAEARRDSASALLERAKLQHRFALTELERTEKLAAEKTVSPQELDSVRLRATASAKEESAAESTLRQADAELAEFAIPPPGTASTGQAMIEIKAPGNGRVLHVFEESARAVTVGMPLVEIGDPADLEVIVEALSRDGAAIGPGTRVMLEQWGGEKPLEARVRLVEPAAFTKISALGVEEQRVNVVADILTPVEERRSLGDNFRIEARIIVWESDRILKVPSGALFRRNGQWSVFVLSGGRARLRAVQVGRSSGSEMQINGGLQEGEPVILYPGDRIRDGLRVHGLKI